MSQLPLEFPLEQRLTFDEFIDTGNVEAVTRCRGLGAETGFRPVWLWGGAATGKTHLLQSVVRDAGAAASIYLPGRRLAKHLPGCFDGLARLALVAIDDVDTLPRDADVEAAFVDLYQQLLGTGAALLLSASRPARALDWALADTGSRLRAADHYELQPLADGGLARLLTRRAAQRGLRVDPAVLDFWLQRAPRRVDLLLEQLTLLDRAALAGKRRLTVPLVKQVLGL